MTRATGELHEYVQKSRDRQAGAARFTVEESDCLASGDPATWLKGLKSYTLRWIAAHLDGGEDRWTPLVATPRPGKRKHPWPPLLRSYSDRKGQAQPVLRQNSP